METPQVPPPTHEHHSKLHIDFLKKIGSDVEKFGEDAVKTTISIALANMGGAFSEE